MVVGEFAEAIDLVVAGAGPGGYTAALRAAALGREVVLVDRQGVDGVGGVCVREGCIPSKALVELADAADGARRLARAGLRAESTVDMTEFQTWKNGVVDMLAGDVRRMLASAGVRIVPGIFRLTGPNRAIVEAPHGAAQFMEFRDCVLAVGSRPAGDASLKRDGERVLDTRDVLSLQSLPASIAVIGVDCFGLEIGVALARLGVHVTLVEREAHLLPGLERALGRAVERALPAIGVETLLSAAVTGLDADCLHISVGGEARTLSVDAVLLSEGRIPNTGDLGLDLAGVGSHPNGLLSVAVDRKLTPHIAAVGDITPGPAFADKAVAEASVAAESLCGMPAAFDVAALPIAVWAEPELASTGMTSDEARAAGIDVSSKTVPMRASARAATQADSSGFLQIVSDTGSGLVVGVHIAGRGATELIGEGVVAIEMGATVEDLALSVHPHPTRGELFQMAARS